MLYFLGSQRKKAHPSLPSPKSHTCPERTTCSHSTCSWGKPPQRGMSRNWPTERGSQSTWARVTRGPREETRGSDTDVSTTHQPHVALAPRGAGVCGWPGPRGATPGGMGRKGQRGDLTQLWFHKGSSLSGSSWHERQAQALARSRAIPGGTGLLASAASTFPRLLIRLKNNPTHLWRALPCIFHLWAIILKKKYQPRRKVLAKFKAKGLGNGKSFETLLGC